MIDTPKGLCYCAATFVNLMNKIKRGGGPVKKLIFTAAMLLCVTFSPNTFAQTTNAVLGGSVSDASGALIPGVTVTATNTGTGIVNTAITNETGTYNFPSLQTGSYTLSAELPGTL